jgi:hypothetical protein
MNTIPHPFEDGDVLLTPSWVLTTNHSASSYGQPVLVDRSTGEAYWPGDMVAPAGRDPQPATMFVHRLGEHLRDEAQKQVALNW